MPAVILQVKVKPRARASSLMQAPDGTWLAKLKAPPVDGKANEELVALVAEHFHCRKSAAAGYGVAGAGLVAVLTAAFATWAIVSKGQVVGFIDAWAYVDAALFAAIALCSRHFRIAPPSQ